MLLVGVVEYEKVGLPEEKTKKVISVLYILWKVKIHQARVEYECHEWYFRIKDSHDRH